MAGEEVAFADTVGGGLAQIAGGGVQQLIGYGLNAMGASKSHDRAKNMITRGPTYARIGLEKAGFNPILALTKGQIPGSGFRPDVARGGPSGQIDPAKGSAMALMRAQTRTTQLMGSKAAAESLLANERTLSLGGEVAEARRLMDFINTPQGQFWVRQKYINSAVPNTPSAMAAKGLMQLMPKAFKWGREHVE